MGLLIGTVLPILTIASNSPLAKAKGNRIDFDAGRLLPGWAIDTLIDEFFDSVLETADVTYRTRNECLGLQKIGISKDGAML